LIVSRSAPTSLAVKLANKLGVTVIGFARGNKLNIYTHQDRIIKE
jgi:FdhD protein